MFRLGSNFTGVSFNGGSQPTVPEPFNFSRAKPRGFLVPDVISKLSPRKHKVATIVPKKKVSTTFGGLSDSSEDSEAEHIEESTSLTLADLEKQRLERLNKARQVVASKYTSPAPALYTSAFEGKKDRTAEVIAERDRELTFKPAKARPAPVFREDEGQVVWNAAAVLAADKKLTDIEQKTTAKLQEFFITGRDSSKFDAWRKAEQEREDAEAALSQALRREELILAREQLQQEQERLQEMRRDAVKEAKGAELRRQSQLEKERQVLVEERMRRVAEVKSWADQQEEIKRELLSQKQKQAAALRAELGELGFWAQKAREVELEEQREKNRLIREAALAGEARQREPAFDRDEVSRTAPVVMEQMSFNQLKERLAERAQEDRDLQAASRSRILTEKQRKAEELAAKAKRIQAYRSGEATKRQTYLAEKVVADFEDLRALQAHQETLATKMDLKVRSKREETWKQQLALHKERKRQVIEQQFQAAGRVVAEQRMHDRHIAAKSSQDVNSQTGYLVDVARHALVKDRDSQARANGHRLAAQARLDTRSAYNAGLERAKEASAEEAAWHAGRVNYLHSEGRARLTEQIANTRARGKRPDIRAALGLAPEGSKGILSAAGRATMGGDFDPFSGDDFTSFGASTDAKAEVANLPDM